MDAGNAVPVAGRKRGGLSVSRPRAQRERTGIPKFGYVGRCCRIKGVDILVAAALQLPRDLEFELRIYGCDWSDLYCRDLRAAAGCAPRIRFYKMLPADEVPERLGSLDVLCIPSVVFETGPLTLREGVYSGCLVAGSDQVGQMDFLTRYGRKIAPNHANAWAEFMRDCILDIGNIRNSRKTEFPEAKSMDSVAENVLSEIRQINEPCRC